MSTSTSISALYEALNPDAVNAALKFTVLQIKKYNINLAFIKALQHDPPQADAYDLFITDGKLITKCLLIPEKNELVEKRRIFPGCNIEILKFGRRHDERNLKSLGPFIVLHDIRRCRGQLVSYTPEEIQSMQWYIFERWKATSADELETHMAGLPDDIRSERLEKLFTDTLDDLEHVPLVGDRGTYVHLLSNDCGLGIKWAPKDLTRGEMHDLSELFETETEELKFIRDLVADFVTNKYKHKNYRATKPVIVARIMRKSRIMNFAQKSDEGENPRWPFKFQLTLADRTDKVEAVVWNKLCPTLYHSLNVGDVVIIRRFREKTPYRPPPGRAPDERNPSDEASNGPVASNGIFDPTETQPEGIMEIALNPGCGIRVISGPLLDDEALSAGLPGYELNIHTANEVSLLSDRSHCDFGGIVTFAGEITRTTFNYVYRWLRMRSGESELLVRVQPNSDFDTFEAISVGDVLLVTNLRLQSIIFNARTRLLHLHSTIYSITHRNEALQFFAECGVEPIQTLLQAHQQFTESPEFAELQEFDEVLGRHYKQYFPRCYGRLPVSKELYPRDREDCTLISEIPFICEQLRWRDTKNILIQGFVKQIWHVSRKWKYNGEVIDRTHKLTRAEDKTAHAQRHIYYIQVEDVNAEHSIVVAVPVFPLLFENGETNILDDWRRLKKPGDSLPRLLEFLSISMPQLKDPKVIESIRSNPKRSLSAVCDFVNGGKNSSSPHRFIFGITLTRTAFDDVECVANNVFS